MSAPHTLAGNPGVLVFERVEVRDAPSQHADASLHIVGGSRDLPSHKVRIFLRASCRDGEQPRQPRIDARSDETHPAFAGEIFTYNSPAPPGFAVAARPGGPLPAVQDDQEMATDVSDAIARLGPVPDVDVTLVFVTLTGAPIDTSQLTFKDIWITRRI